jgi:hypothetical protein
MIGLRTAFIMSMQSERGGISNENKNLSCWTFRVSIIRFAVGMEALKN